MLDHTVLVNYMVELWFNTVFRGRVLHFIQRLLANVSFALLADKLCPAVVALWLCVQTWMNAMVNHRVTTPAPITSETTRVTVMKDISYTDLPIVPVRLQPHLVTLSFRNTKVLHQTTGLTPN